MKPTIKISAFFAMAFVMAWTNAHSQSGGGRTEVYQGDISAPTTTTRFATGTLPNGSTAHRWDVYLTAGRQYTFTHCYPGSSSYDDWLLLRDSSNAILVSNDDSCSLKAQISYTPSVSGIYRLIVSGFTYNFGNYETAYFYTVNAPTVSTTAVSNIDVDSATSGGNVSADGGASVTSRGIVWSSQTSSPTTESNQGKNSHGSGTGSFTSNMTDLTPGTTYYVRAYATNSAGTSYGGSVQFTTIKLNQSGVAGTLGTSSIQYGNTTTLTASGGQGSGAYEFRQNGGTGTVSISGSGNPRTLTGTAVGTANMEVRKLGDATYNDSAWVSAGTLNITKAPLTVTAVDKSKVYGDSEPTLTFTPSGTLYHGDSYNEVITGVVLSAPTGADATAGVHTITASGGTATNYEITHVNGTLTVSQRPLTGSFTVESPKVYDDTTAARVLTCSLSNLATWDAEDTSGVQLTGGVANFDTKAVGTGKTVTLTGMTLSGDRSANYFLETMNTTTADIIPGAPSMQVPPVLQEQDDEPPAPGVVSTAVAGVALKPIRVQFFDFYGNPVGAGYKVTVTLNQATFADNTTELEAVTGADGSVTVSGLIINKADEDYTLTFTIADEPEPSYPEPV